MSKKCCSLSLRVVNATLIFMAGSLWGAVLLASFLQGLSLQRPQENAFLSLFNIGMPVGSRRAGALPAATTLAIFDAVNQGVISVLSHFSRQISHVTHSEPLAGPKYAVMYAGLGLFMGVGSSMSAYNGLIQAIMDIGLAEHSSRIGDMEQKALGLAITIAALSGFATAYFAYSRGREIHDKPWYPTTLKNRTKFLATVMLRNLGQLSLNFYQAQRATGSAVVGVIISFLSVLGMNLTQMKAHGINMRNAERHLDNVSNVSMPFVSSCLYHYLKYSNWFNIIAAPAILRSNLSQIQVYKDNQDEPQVWIPTVVAGFLFGWGALAVSDSIRISAIENLFATPVVSDFKEWVRPLLEIKGDALLCWSSGVDEEAQPLLPH